MIHKIKNLGITISLIVITYSIYLYVNKIELYNLKKIEIRGNKFVKNDVIESILDIYKNKNIHTLNIKEIQNSINKHPYIKSNKIFKMLPNRIIVSIKETVPIALIEQDKSIFFLDTNFNKIESDIASLNYYSVPILTNNINNNYTNIRDILTIIRAGNMNFYNSMNELIISDNIILIRIANGTKIKIDNSHKINNTLKLLSFLETIKNNKKITDYKYVDLTIPKQIIVKENNKL